MTKHKMNFIFRFLNLYRVKPILKIKLSKTRKLKNVENRLKVSRVKREDYKTTKIIL